MLLGLLAFGLVRKHDLSSIQAIFYLCLFPSIILHEISHGVVALWCGDDTAKQAGRVSLNPIRHIDPLGTVILPVLLIVTTGYAFGWAKPVPVRVDRLRHPRNQAVLVGLAGPATNLLIAVIAGLVVKLYYVPHLQGAYIIPDTLPLVPKILVLLAFANIIIAVFNLIPIPPLDGSAIVERLIPQAWLPGYYRIRMGFLFVVLFIAFASRNLLGDVYSHLFTVWLNAVGLL